MNELKQSHSSARQRNADAPLKSYTDRHYGSHHHVKSGNDATQSPERRGGRYRTDEQPIHHRDSGRRSDQAAAREGHHYQRSDQRRSRGDHYHRGDHADRRKDYDRSGTGDTTRRDYHTDQPDNTYYERVDRKNGVSSKRHERTNRSSRDSGSSRNSQNSLQRNLPQSRPASADESSVNKYVSPVATERIRSSSQYYQWNESTGSHKSQGSRSVFDYFLFVRTKT